MVGAQAGEVVYLLGAAVGVSTLIASSPVLLEVLRYAGAAYLIFLGVRQILRRNQAAETSSAPSVRGLAAQGFVLQILNPKLRPRRFGSSQAIPRQPQNCSSDDRRHRGRLHRPGPGSGRRRERRRRPTAGLSRDTDAKKPFYELDDLSERRAAGQRMPDA